MLEAIIQRFADGNKAQFAKLVGLSPQGISSWFARKNFDSELIYSKCVGISSHWLLTGEGDMLEKKKPESHLKDCYSDNDGIPLIPIDAMAGVLSGEIQVMNYECERYIVPEFRGADFLIRVKGDSMYPLYNSGDIVACMRVPMKDLFFQWNKAYVLDTNQGAIIKRIRRGSDENHILIVSENRDYEPFELHLKNVYAVALVVGVIRPE